MLITPISNITDTANVVLGVILFGFGAYVWVSVAAEMIDGDEKSSVGEDD